MQSIIDFIRGILLDGRAQVTFFAFLTALVAAIATQCGVPSP